MGSHPASDHRFRVEKVRADALITLANGQTVKGCFFVAGASARTTGRERVLDLLNAETGFFPFELHDPTGTRMVLYNRNQVVMVALAEDESSRDAGYELAISRPVTIGLSSGRRVTGHVRVYRPEGRDRLSDWARQPDVFRYLEADDVTLIINVTHVLDVSETN